MPTPGVRSSFHAMSDIKKTGKLYVGNNVKRSGAILAWYPKGLSGENEKHKVPW
jgi:hypothetical protein